MDKLALHTMQEVYDTDSDHLSFSDILFMLYILQIRFFFQYQTTFNILRC